MECSDGSEPVGWHDEGWAYASSGTRKVPGVPNASGINKRTCRGILKCECRNETGKYTCLTRPVTGTAGFKKQLLETCPMCHHIRTHISCSAYELKYHYTRPSDSVERLVRHHFGRHNHEHPPAKSLSSTDRNELDELVRKNPKATAFQHRVGAEHGMRPLSLINPVLSDPRKARHEVEKSKQRIGLPSTQAGAGSTGFIERMQSLNDRFSTPWIVDSQFIGRTYVSLQTPFMRSTLLRESVMSWSRDSPHSDSRHGIISDSSFDFFDSGYLLSSYVYSVLLLRWVPVMYTWMGSQDADHHVPHFGHLISAICSVVSPAAPIQDHILASVSETLKNMSQKLNECNRFWTIL